MNKKDVQGVVTEAITPVNQDGSIDIRARKILYAAGSRAAGDAYNPQHSG